MLSNVSHGGNAGPAAPSGTWHICAAHPTMGDGDCDAGCAGYCGVRLCDLPDDTAKGPADCEGDPLGCVVCTAMFAGRNDDEADA